MVSRYLHIFNQIQLVFPIIFPVISIKYMQFLYINYTSLKPFFFFKEINIRRNWARSLILSLQPFSKFKIIPNEFIFLNGTSIQSSPEENIDTRIWMEVVSLGGDSRNHPAGLTDLRWGREGFREAVLASGLLLQVMRCSLALKHGRQWGLHLSYSRWEAGGWNVKPRLPDRGWGLPWRWTLPGCLCGPSWLQWPETALRQRVAGLVV